MSHELFMQGLDAPICLTWEVTYACNLRCRHCLSASGTPALGELDTARMRRVIDELAELQVFYINVGGGEPFTRPDFHDLMDHAIARNVGVKVSTNGSLIDDATADWIARTPYLDIQISVDGATAEANDRIRGRGSFDTALRAMDRLSKRGFRFTVNSVVTRANIDHLDEMVGLAASRGAELRLSRLRPTGRGARVWRDLRLDASQDRHLYGWLMAHPEVATGDSFFHLSAFGAPLPGMNMCGAGRIVCLIDPVGDVYACPFLIAPEFRAGNVLEAGGFARIWRRSPLFASLRRAEPGEPCRSCPAERLCHGGCMAAKHFAGMDLAGLDPDCVIHRDEAEDRVPVAFVPLAGLARGVAAR